MNFQDLESFRRSANVEVALRSWMKEATDLKSALDASAIVAITAPQGGIKFANEKFCAVSRYSQEEILGQDHRILNSGHHPPDFFRDLWAAISAGRVWRGEIKNRAKNGSFYWLATTIVPSLDDRGKPRQYVAISTDITESKRVAAELEAKLRLQGLLAQLSSRFVALPSEEIDSAISEAQQHIVEALGLDRSTLWQAQEGKPGMMLTHCWQREGWPSMPAVLATEDMVPWTHKMVSRGEPFSFSSIHDLPAEAARDVEIFLKHGPKSSVTLPLMSGGRSFGALAFSTLGEERTWQADEVADLKLIAQIIGNVVSRQRAEDRAEQLRSEIAHSTRAAMLGELTAALAHELNQPLTAILSNAQAGRRFMAGGEINQQEISAILEDVIRDGKRAGGVIHNLRAMLGHAPVVREASSLNELVAEVVEFMHSELIGHDIELSVTLAHDLPSVHVAKVEIQQVLVNLLLNASQSMKDASPAPRRIELETRDVGDAVGVSIHDHGHGIPPERLDTIFEPFFTTKSSGLGIGLAICRRIVEVHDGSIHASNHEDGGAVFSFLLPKLAGSRSNQRPTRSSRELDQMQSGAKRESLPSN
jgi:PAS domain S-box-containing protein